MSLAFAGWEYGFVVPFALAVLAFAVFSWYRTPASAFLQFKSSVVFWCIGLAPIALFLVIGVALSVSEIRWNPAEAHKAFGLAVGALIALYLPFALVAILSFGKRWRSSLVYSAVLASTLLPLLVATPFLVAASAIISCALMQVAQCL
jgi:hypothetical protein